MRHERRRRDEGLLVGERQSSSGFERRHRHRQAGEAHDRVDDDVRTLRQFGEARGANHELDARAEQFGECLAVVFTRDADASHVKLLGDRRKLTETSSARDRDEFERLGLAAQYVEGLGADRTGGAQERHTAPRRGHR